MELFQCEQFFTCQKSISYAALLSAHLALLAPFRVNTKPQNYSSQWMCLWDSICLCQ